MNTQQKILIWDIPTRLFHWLLVLALIAQWLTAEVLDDAIQLHMYIGYFTLGLIIFRISWGFIGPKYARFNDFVSSPRDLIHALKTIRRAEHSTGHNPLGGLMVIAMLVIILLQAISGLFTSDDILFNGPYANWASKEWQSFWQSLHHQLFDWILILVGLHIAAVIVHQLVLKHNIVLPMLTGKKALTSDKQINSSRILLALALVIAVAALVYWLVAILPPVEEEFYY